MPIHESLDQLVQEFNDFLLIRFVHHSVLKKLKLKTTGVELFSFVAPKLWNSLPEDIKNAKTVICFKNKLKTHLFRKDFITLVSIMVNLIR